MQICVDIYLRVPANDGENGTADEGQGVDVDVHLPRQIAILGHGEQAAGVGTRALGRLLRPLRSGRRSGHGLCERQRRRRPCGNGFVSATALIFRIGVVRRGGGHDDVSIATGKAEAGHTQHRVFGEARLLAWRWQARALHGSDDLRIQPLAIDGEAEHLAMLAHEHGFHQADRPCRRLQVAQVHLHGGHHTRRMANCLCQGRDLHRVAQGRPSSMKLNCRKLCRPNSCILAGQTNGTLLRRGVHG
mmetsp:Transcript_73450/g.175149  ORF Transcript_73450/g.175149 Transcript_73450/m.175149 type:complete len:246 (+) Transcript_73450:1951-2688(+)